MKKKEFFESDMIKKFVNNPLNSKVTLSGLNKYCNYLISNGYNETEHVKLTPAITSRVYETYDMETKAILVVTDYENMVNYFRLQLETIHNDINNDINEYAKQHHTINNNVLYHWYVNLAKVSYILADLSVYMDSHKNRLYRIEYYTDGEYKIYEIKTLDNVIKTHSHVKALYRLM